MRTFRQNLFKRATLAFLLVIPLLLGLQPEVLAQSYCSPSYPNGTASWYINAVNINSFSHSPSSSQHDYTAQSFSVTAGNVLTMTVTTTGWLSVGTAADWNNDGDFDDVEEVLDVQPYSANSPATYNYTVTIPSTIPAGSYRFRLWTIGGNSGDGNPASSPCGNYGYGNWVDYTINVLPNSVCSGTPIGGSANVPQTVAVGSNYVVSATGQTNALGMSYQWQSRTNGGAWVNMGNASASYSNYTATAPATVGVSVDWRLAVTCTSLGLSDTSLIASTTSVLAYCEVTSTNSGTYGIGNFTTTGGISNINNSSQGTPYSDFTNFSVSQFPGMDIGFTITSLYSTEGMAIWVDWNNDGNFDASEKMYASNSYLATVTSSFTVPLTAQPGNHRMRVVGNYLTTTPTACGDLGYSAYGEAEDYTFVVVSLAPCSDAVAGSLSGPSAPFCAQDGTTITALNASSPAGGLDFVWQENINGAGWQSIAGASGASLNYIPSVVGVDVDIRLVVNCATGNLTDTSAPITVHVKPGTECYCVVTSTNNGNYGISNFKTTGGISNIDNSSSGSPYSDFTSMAVSQIPGMDVSFEITSASSTAGMAIWVDWNDDGIFDASEKMYASGTYVAVGSGNFTVPLTAQQGNHRMRVVGNYLSTNPTPCGDLGSAAYGEAEDYMISVLDPTPCSSAVAGTISSSVSEAYGGQTISLSSQNGSTPMVGLSAIWQSSPSGQDAWVSLPGGSISATSIVMPVEKTDFRLIVNCNSGVADTSNVVTVNLKAPDYVPVALNGFNYDVIANGVGPSINSTTNDVDGVKWVLVSEDFKASSSSTVLPARSLPANRSIQNQEIWFLLNDYSQNNSLRLTSNQSGFLKFLTPKKAKVVHVLGISGSGVSTVNATVYFDDGTTQTVNNLNYPDWYDNTPSVVASKVGRWNRETDVDNDNANGPNLYDQVLNINVANQSKQIDSIKFTTNSSSHIMNVLSASIVPPDNVSCPTPSLTSLSASNVLDHSVTINWDGNGTTQDFEISWANPGVVADNGNIVGNITGTSHNLTGLSDNTEYYVYVRAKCGPNEYSDWAGPLVIHTALELCSGTPFAGIISGTNPLEVCAGQPINLATSGTTIAGGINYQWQQRGAGSSNWTDIVGANTLALNLPNGIGDNMEYRMYVVCGAVGASDTTMPISANVTICYCDPPAITSTVEPITRVTFAGIDNQSSASTSGGAAYQDFTSSVAAGSVAPGQSYPISLKGNTAGSFTNYFTVWLDFNQNGTFETSERFQIGSINNSSGTDNKTATGNILIPPDAPAGVIRMRVIKNYSTSPLAACAPNTYSFGQVEDYSIQVGWPYVASFVSASVNSNSLVCSDAELPIDITLKNIGFQNWGASGQNIHLRGRWGNTGAWEDLGVVTNNANQTQTYTVNMSVPSQTGANELQFDLQKGSGDFFADNTWSSNNQEGTGPNNSVYTISVNIAEGVTADLGANVVDICNFNVLNQPGSLTIAHLDPQVTGSNLSYEWSDQSVGSTLDVNIDGVYWVRVENTQSHCFATDTINVVKHTPTIPFNGQNGQLCANDSLVLDMGAGFSQYEWVNYSDNSQAHTFYGYQLASGDFVTLIGRAWDAYGCFAEGSVIVLPTDTATLNLPNIIDICQGEVATLDPQAFDPDIDQDGFHFGYNWGTGAQTSTITASTPGIYTLRVYDTTYFTGLGAFTCVSRGQVELAVHDTPTVAFNGQQIGVCEGFTLTLDAENPNAVSHVWSDASQTDNQFLPIDQPGTYSVTIEDQYGCIGLNTVEIVETDTPVVTLSDNGTLYVCEDGTITIDAQNPGAVGYEWFNDQGLSLGTGSTVVVDSTVNIGVIVTAPGGCTGHDTVAVIWDALPVVDLGNDFNICAGNSFTLNAGHPGMTYEWQDGSDNQTFVVDQTGFYSVTVTDQHGCVGVSNTVEVVSTGPIVPLPSDTAFCVGTTLTLDAGPDGVVYNWNNGQGNTQTFDITQPGDYTVSVMNNYGCPTVKTVHVTENQLPIIPIADTAICDGSVVTLDAGSPNGTYLWSTGATTQTIDITTAGNYSVEVTDANGCVNNAQMELTVNQGGTVDLGADQTVCANIPVSLDATQPNAISYLWSNGDTTATTQTHTQGTQSVDVVLTTGCVMTGSMDVIWKDTPVVDLGGDQAICIGESVTLDAGTNGTFYNWSGISSNNQTVTVSNAGTYSVSVVNLTTGCVGSDEMTLTVMNPQVNLGNDTIIDPSIPLVLDAGNPGAEYLWMTPNGVVQGTQQIPVVSGGTYSVEVNYLHDCSAADTILVSIHPLVGCDTLYPDFIFDLTHTILPGLPGCMTEESLNPTSDNSHWETAATDNGDGFPGNVAFESPATALGEGDMDNWLYSQVIGLEAGVEYQVNFRYGLSDAGATGGFTIALASAEDAVPSGPSPAGIGSLPSLPTPAGMTQIVFQNNNVQGGAYTDTTQTFTVAQSGYYFMGFHAIAPAGQGAMRFGRAGVTTLPTPVRMGPLTATLDKESKAHLNWTTFEERNNQGFEVERSEDGRQFNRIGFVTAGDGNVNGATGFAYHFNDPNVVKNVSFYRLRQVDLDGRSTYSNIVQLFANGKDGLSLSVHPNPVKQVLTVEINGNRSGDAYISIMDLSGRVLKQVPVKSEKVFVDMEGMASGAYMLRYVDDQHSQVIKVVKD